MGPMPPNMMNSDEASVISISEALRSAWISGIPGNYRKRLSSLEMCTKSLTYIDGRTKSIQ